MATVQSLDEAYVRALLSEASRNPDLRVVFADSAKRFRDFLAKHPEKSIQVGIAEQNQVGIAAGLALSGKLPVVAAFAFLMSMRSCEQVRTDLCYPNLNVKLLSLYAGVSMGSGGTTHHSIEDIAILRSFAGMTVVVPADASSTEAAMKAALSRRGPVYIRIDVGSSPTVYENEVPFEIGKANRLRDGADLTIAACGIMVARALEAADILGTKGIEARVLDVHSVKPIDRDAIVSAAKDTRLIVTAEQHSIVGGLGSAVAEVVSLEHPTRVVRLGVPDAFCPIGSQSEILDYYGLNGPGIADAVQKALRP